MLCQNTVISFFSNFRLTLNICTHMLGSGLPTQILQVYVVILEVPWCFFRHRISSVGIHINDILINLKVWHVVQWRRVVLMPCRRYACVGVLRPLSLFRGDISRRQFLLSSILKHLRIPFDSCKLKILGFIQRVIV